MTYTKTRFTAPLSIVPFATALLGVSTTALAQDEPAAAEPVQVAQAGEVSLEAQVEADVETQAVAEPPPPPPAAAPLAPPPAAPEEPEAGESAIQVNLGVGVRADVQLDPNVADEVGFNSSTNLRPYAMGQVHENVKFEGNMDVDLGSETTMLLLDAVLKFEFGDYANFWVGRFLPPTDRANLSGPYFQNAWNYPAGQHLYANNGATAGRNNGLAYWGQYNGGQVKWQLGLFDMGPGGPTTEPRFAGRVVVNVLDPEPGYYNSSTYYGAKDVLAIGAALHHKPAPDGAPSEVADTTWNLDLLYENSFPGTGTLDVEGAFYGFGGADEGTSFSVLASFMLANQMGFGYLQPMARLQMALWDQGDAIPGYFFGSPFVGGTAPDDDTSQTTIDVGLHYIIDGHNARLAATFSYVSLAVGDINFTDTLLTLGGQIQAF